MTRLLFPLLAALLIFASAASAQPGRRSDTPGFRRLEKLGLSADQKSALKDAMRNHRKNMIDLRASASKKRLDIVALMEKESPDRQSFEKFSKEMADVQLQQRMLLFDMRQSLMNVLTPEQRKIWIESRGKGMKHGRGREGMRRGPRGDDDDHENDED